MVFSSVPLYLDPPNWQQHQPNQQVLQGGNNNNNNNNQVNHEQNLHLLPPPPQQQQAHQLGVVGGGGGPGAQQIRPNSMAERARLAKIPPPEAPLKCPRCESTNTKFCYFNNYSLSQPRHFCKTCRRYWTRGGALRNVPVGGGSRRKQRTSSKSSSGGGSISGPSSSKSSLSSPMGDRHGGGGGGLDHHHYMTSSEMSNLSSLTSLPAGIGNMSFMASLQNMAQLGGMSNLGLTFGGGSLHNNNHNSNNNPLGGLGANVVGNGNGNGDHNMEYPQLNQHHHSGHHQQGNSSSTNHVQFPNFLGGFEIPGSSSGGAGLYISSFQSDNNQGIGGGGGGGGDDDDGGDEHEQVDNISKSLTTMMSPVKMENTPHHGLNLAKQLMGISSSSDNMTSGGGGGSNNPSNNQFWGGTLSNATGVTSMWTDLSGLNSSSTSHLL